MILIAGTITLDPDKVLTEGGQVVAQALPRPPMEMIGHVTSSYWSETLGRSIALAVLVNGRSRIGSTVELAMLDGTVSARVTEPVFYDSTGERMRG